MTIPKTNSISIIGFYVLAVVAAVFIAGCTAPSADEQDKNWTRAQDLIATSDRILTVRFVESRNETIQLTNPGAGLTPGEIEVLFRQFEVIDTLKGTSDPEDRLWVAFEPGRAGELVDGQGQVQVFRDGPTYMLFLKGRLRPLEYPTEFGPVLWTGNGEPSFAELTGEQLIFRADRVFFSLLERDGTQLPSPASAAPFELTLPEIETITR